MTSLINFWLDNPKLWFNSTIKTDDIIKNKFGINHKDLIISSKDKPTECLNNIIVYDQIVKHIYRNNPVQIKLCNIIAVKLCNDGLKKKYDLELSPKARTFFLMPLRHTFNIYEINRVINIIQSYDNWKEEPEYIRFYKASLRSLSKLITKKIKKEKKYIDNEKYNFNHICDYWSTKFCITPKSLSINNQSLITTCKNFLDEYNNNDTITISLSGGVDSMVCCYIFNSLKTTYNFKLQAIHINYNNRSSCIEEKKFLNWFCSLLNIDLYIRDINEIHRKRDIMRSFYEEITQEIRFDTYKHIGGNIILGHNKNDCTENIFSNIRKKRNFENLIGMKYKHIQNDVEIWRPFLDTDKETLINFAKEVNIPYFVDSTPSWSDRGKMRDKLIPTIKKFNKDIIPGLFYLNNKITEQNILLENFIYKPFKNNIVWKDTRVITQNNDKLPEIFWKEIMIKIARHLNCKYPSNKSINYFMKCISKPNIKKINLNKHINIEKTDLNIIFYKNNLYF